MLEVVELSKKYDEVTVLDKVNLKIRSGEIYGLVGENGAGKTTLMKIIMTLVKKTEGIVNILGEEIELDNKNILKEVGSIVGAPVFYENWTGFEVLRFHCNYFGDISDKKINDVINLVGLEKDAKKKVKKYSLGTRQKLAIARAIVTDPKILIFDEPINALDPSSVKTFNEIITFLAKEKKVAILISSHILSQVEKIATKIAFIKSGKIIDEVSVSDLINKDISLEKYYNKKMDDVSSWTKGYKKECLL